MLWSWNSAEHLWQTKLTGDIVFTLTDVIKTGFLFRLCTSHVTQSLRKIFRSGAYLFTVQYCLPLFSSSIPLIRKNLLLGAAPSHTQIWTLKPMLSNTLVASHTTGNNWSPVKPADAWWPTVHFKWLNIPRIINTFTYLANFLLKYSLLLFSSFTLYWRSCIS